MAKFIQVQVAAGTYGESMMEASHVYINVEMVKSVAQNQQNPDRSSIRFAGEEHAMHVAESAESFVSRAGAA